MAFEVKHLFSRLHKRSQELGRSVPVKEKGYFSRRSGAEVLFALVTPILRCNTPTLATPGLSAFFLRVITADFCVKPVLLVFFFWRLPYLSA